MNKVERQILENQYWMMRTMRESKDISITNSNLLKEKSNETIDLLCPSRNKEDCCDMSEGIHSKGQD